MACLLFLQAGLHALAIGASVYLYFFDIIIENPYCLPLGAVGALMRTYHTGNGWYTSSCGGLSCKRNGYQLLVQVVAT